ncbi:response regulator [Silanimonas sp.]|uniref:response regulator n=1 Tax=Silanimonas sp. TaxID=1929290 RepID=UPI001BC3A66D|nr:response regulator [Silanimonas sp.]MBS3895702.1 response regulator [Silanimonas sp.]MBS3924379.1 response regulator [Xanthomonadaceae bacterium]
MSLLDRLKRFLTQASSSGRPEDAINRSELEEESKARAGLERRLHDRRNARDGTRALIIDDSATVTAALERMLLQNRYQLETAADAEQGLEKIAHQAPEIVFLDIVLPGINGFEALRRIRRDAASRDIPVIMMSGNEQATEQFYAQRIGADDFMKKPFSRFEVFARVEKLLDAEDRPRRASAST